jgi:hypothetical protein
VSPYFDKEMIGQLLVGLMGEWALCRVKSEQSPDMKKKDSQGTCG